MDYFEYKTGRLFCEGVDISDIADSIGTPVYVYSKATLLHHYNAIAEAFVELKPTICFSIKSLSNVHVLKVLSEAGSGFDVVSGGELARAKAAGADMSRIVFAGVGKTDRELTEAIDAGIGVFNIESEAEFENLSRLADLAGKNVRAALRLNPDVYDPKTHRYTMTGKKETKFGVDIDLAERFFQTHGSDARVCLDGLHIHIGSSICSPQPYVRAIEKTLELISRLRSKGRQIRLLDIGGGFGADYEQGSSPLAADYAGAIVPLLRDAELEVVIEPGRQIACNAGVLISRVQYVKTGGEKNFVIVDAASTDLIRPALYGAEHFVYPTRLAEGAPPPQRKMDFAPPGGVKVDVVGGVCETSDFLATDRVLPPMQRGELLAIFSAGAYGFVMSSQYNSRPRAAEVMVDGEAVTLIRRREIYEDLLAPEMDV